MSSDFSFARDSCIKGLDLACKYSDKPQDIDDQLDEIKLELEFIDQIINNSVKHIQKISPFQFQLQQIKGNNYYIINFLF